MVIALLVYLALLALLLLACAAWARERRALTPAASFAAYWAAASAAPVLLTSFSITAAGLWYLVSAVLAFTVGSISATGLGGYTKIDLPPPGLVVRGRVLRILVWAGSVSGVASALVVIYGRGSTLDRLMTTQGFLESGNETATAIFSGGHSVGLLVPGLLAVTYAASVAAPFAAHGARSRWRHAMYLVLPSMGALANSLVTTKRLGFLLTASITMATWVVYATIRDGGVPRISFKLAPKIAGSIASLAIVFSALAFVRVGGVGESLRPVILQKLQVYGFGYLPAFSGWFETHWAFETVPFSVGGSTVAGVGGLFSPGRGSQAIEGFRTISGNGLKTNVFTTFRYIIEDFGTAGSLVALYLLGLLTTRAHIAAKRGRIWYGAVWGVWFAALPLAATQPIYIFANVLGGVLFGWWLVARRVEQGRAPVGSKPVDLAGASRKRLGDEVS